MVPDMFTHQRSHFNNFFNDIYAGLIIKSTFVQHQQITVYG